MSVTAVRVVLAGDLDRTVSLGPLKPVATAVYTPASLWIADIGQVALAAALPADADENGVSETKWNDALERTGDGVSFATLLAAAAKSSGKPAVQRIVDHLLQLHAAAAATPVDLVFTFTDDQREFVAVDAVEAATAALDRMVVCVHDHAGEAKAEGIAVSPESVPAPLRSFDAVGVADYIQRKGITKVMVMSGAGISCAAGIPDFRTAGTGLYDNLDKYDLPSPEALFTLDYLQEHPEKFYTVCNEMQLWPGCFAPTHAHHFLQQLQASGRLLRCYTQNIDGLERLAGVDGDRLVEAHGTFSSAHCINRECRAEYPVADAKAAVQRKEVPRCAACGSVAKPDVVFFGEALPARFREMLEQDLTEVQLLLVMGTSLEVQPFAMIHSLVDKDVPRVLLNMERCGDFVFHGDALTGGAKAMRDVFLRGDCQAACKELAAALGFAPELEAGYQRVKGEMAASKQAAVE
jgi:NAD-dependent deacetylase sirtuin 2